MDVISDAADILMSANRVIIGAGAGLSASAGLDYTDEVSFATRFPGMLQYGVKNRYQLIGFNYPSEAVKWGYLSVALDEIYTAKKNKVYQDLRAIVGNRDYFVMTSNVDRYFHKNEFSEDRVYTPQGDYERFQCLNRCHEGTWDGKPIVANLLPSVDWRTQSIKDLNLIPKCPRCGGPVFMNVRGGNWFIEKPYEAHAESLSNWLPSFNHEKLAVLEIGSGFNTPGVVRGPMEAIARHFSFAPLIRINPEHAEGPGRTISINMDAKHALSKIRSSIS